MRQFAEEQRMKSMVKSLHANAQPLADACNALAVNRGKSVTVVCYFGGPTAASGVAFKAVYQAMLDHALPDLETVCSPEPITSKTASTKTFGAFSKTRAGSIGWDALQADLKSDGFVCANDRCQHVVFGVMLEKGSILDKKSNANGKPSFAIIPRYVEVYHGDWHRIGPGSCLIDKNGKQDFDCALAKNGVQNGICLASEDWHTWGLLLYGMNDSGSE
jgi:hypothetical protein